MKTLAGDSGETLVELMITIVIMAVGVTAVVAALSMTIKGSDLHHSLSQGEVMIRDYGEAIKEKASGLDP
jgi:Tfp pilus assembly protein PilV